MKTRVAAVGIIKHSDKFLLVKRGLKTKHSPGKWGCVGGLLKEFESVEDGIVREIKEETGLEVRIIKRGEIFEVDDNDIRWIIIPVLCESDTEKVVIDRNEISDYRWIHSNEIKNFDTVPGIDKTLEAVGLS